MAILRRFQVYVTAIVLLFTIVSAAHGKYSGGTGEPNDPYQIATAEDLMLLSESLEDYDKHFILTADIDLDPKLPGRKVFDKAVIAPDMNDANWEFDGTPFIGVFDGEGYTISHLTITGKYWLGLFGRLKSEAVVKNLGMMDVNVSGPSVPHARTLSSLGCIVGALVGSNDGIVMRCYSTGIMNGMSSYVVGGLIGVNYGGVTDCYSTCSVSGHSIVGGLVGSNNGSINTCYSTGLVSGGFDVGGLVGQNHGGRITTSYSSATVTAELYVGGLVGNNNDAVTQCYSTGTISGRDYVGGLVGDNYGSVTHCYSTGNVSGSEIVGGLVGGNNYEVALLTHCYSTGTVSASGQVVGGLVGYNGGSITTSYSTSSVSGTSWVGGLAGRNGVFNFGMGYSEFGRVTRCYSTGMVSGESYIGGLVGGIECGTVTQCYSAGAVSGIEYVGGLLGSDYWVTSTACFWDIETSGQTMSAEGTGLSTVQMKDIQTYLNAGWDFYGEIMNGTHDVWLMPEGGGYPVLAMFSGYTPPQLYGAGTPDDPYLVSDAMELGAMVYYDPSAHYRLASSLDLSGIHWGMAVIPWFAGMFDGDGHAITHLTIQGGDVGPVGMFGYLRDGAVKSLGVVDVNIAGSLDSVGGLVGSNSGILTDCYITGAVSGNYCVGGLVGDNYGSVTNCYSTASVSGDGTVGGLIGYHTTGSVAQCYSTGAVTGQSVGGLLGQILYGHETACFWDIEASGQTKSAGGTGKTTSEMQTDSTFLEAGWDFMDETANGTEDIWWILEGQDYPRLWWEAAEQ